MGHMIEIVQGCHEKTSLFVGQPLMKEGLSRSDFVVTPVKRIYSRIMFVRKARELKHDKKHYLTSEGRFGDYQIKISIELIG